MMPRIRYCVICDARRPDLIDAWFTIAKAVKLASLRSRLQLATWQEIAATLPKSMRVWLAGKYGIVSQTTPESSDLIHGAAAIRFGR